MKTVAMKTCRLALALALASCGGSAAQTGGAAAPGPSHGVDEPDAKKPAPMIVPVTIPEAQLTFDDASKSFEAAGSDCASMCKALSSMSRATERLCELVKDEPDAEKKRCDDAKTRLASADAKVKASCGVCS